VNGTLFEWLTRLYPVWAGIDEEASYLAAWVGLAELALGRLHLDRGPPLHRPARRGRPVGGRDRGGAGGGPAVPPDPRVDDGLAEGRRPAAGLGGPGRRRGARRLERLVAAFHDATPASMLRVALAPCSPFSVSPALMTATAELAERLDVRLHTHLAEDLDEDDYCLERFGRRPVDQFAEVGWLTPRAWVAHCIYPDASEITRLGAAGVGVAHCPSSNMILGNGRICPVRDLRAAGTPVGLGCDGSSSNDMASLWLEARTALLLGKMRAGRPRRRRGTRCTSRPGAARRAWPHGGDRRADGRRLRRPRGLGGRPDRARRVRAPTRSRRGCGCGPGRGARRSWRDGFSSRTARSRWRGSTTSWPATAPWPRGCRTHRSANGCTRSVDNLVVPVPGGVVVTEQ
jgi:hypothetical protein